jgi:hypothetical protein
MTIETCEHASPRECDALYELDRRFVCIDCLTEAYLEAKRDAKKAAERTDMLLCAAGHNAAGVPLVLARANERRGIA